MKIEKINNNKIRILFGSDELIENNISVHSFLANSIESQKLFLALLDIAKEDLGFDTSNSTLFCETISFSNKSFIVIVTKQNTNNSKYIQANKKSFLFYDNNLLNSKIESFNIENILLYSFSNLDSVFSFSSYLKANFDITTINSFLYNYNSHYYLKLDIKDLSSSNKLLLTNILCEYKNFINISLLTLKKLEEYATLLISTNAINIL